LNEGIAAVGQERTVSTENEITRFTVLILVEMELTEVQHGVERASGPLIGARDEVYTIEGLHEAPLTIFGTLALRRFKPDPRRCDVGTCGQGRRLRVACFVAGLWLCVRGERGIIALKWLRGIRGIRVGAGNTPERRDEEKEMLHARDHITVWLA
jgi:hypothetical protein